MADEHITFVTYALTQLKQRILEAPPFWTSTTSGFAGDIEDENIVSQVLEAAIQSELKYKRVLEDRRIEAIERAKKAAEEALAKRQKEKEDEIKPKQG